MRSETRENARVIWIPSFVAFYNTSNLTQASKAVWIDPKTVRDHVRELEDWLHRPLMDERENVPWPTLDAKAFFPDALAILLLLNDNGMQDSIKTARVRPDGTYVEDGIVLRTNAAIEIGSRLVKFRADLTHAKPFIAPPKVSGASIDMKWWDPSKPLSEKKS